MGKSKKKIVVVVGFVLVASVAIYVFYPSEYRRDVAKLEQVCAELSENDPNGRVYEPIVGRYLGSKSEIYSVTVQGPETTELKIVLDSDISGEISVYHNFPVEESVSIISDNFFSVVEKKSIVQKMDSKNMHGICAYKNEHDIYTGDIGTFMKLIKE